MKKILLFLMFSLISLNATLAQETFSVENVPISEQEMKKVLKNTQPPTEEEILQQLKDYSMSEEEAINLYNKAKSHITKSYKEGSVEYFMELQNTPEFRSIQNKVIEDIQKYKELNEQYLSN